jgi:TrmH family RNA methyltransferase
MLTKNNVKHIKSLALKKNRVIFGEFVAEGEKVVSDLLQTGMTCKSLLANNQWLEKNSSLIKKADQIIEISLAELKKISNLSTPNEVLAIIATPDYRLNIQELNQSLTIGLDNIQDPGNLGAIIRLADWFGIEDIICSEDCVDCFNSKVVQATMGSIARVKLHYVDMASFLENISKNNDLPVYGACLNGKNIYEQKLSSRGLIMMGNESKGISNNLFKFIAEPLLIPNFSTNKKIDSLNVAVATAIICSEFRRKS